jgi:farnesyl diphosphate synthase
LSFITIAPRNSTSTGKYALAATEMNEFEIARHAAALATEAAFERMLPHQPDNRLHAAMRYAALGQGKRLRPFFVLESAKLYGVSESRALPVAVALECIHCYSLVHDDLPAMDNDDLRRGKPTTHKQFDDATAILAGDALLTLAFEILANAGEPPQLIAALAKAAGEAGMVGGQMLDIEAETKNFGSLDEISIMQSLKTGALFEFACIAGPLMAGQNIAAMKTYAHNIGIAFQIVDDILDVESSAAMLGKATQKDQTKGKATFVDFLGLTVAKKQAAELIESAKAALMPFTEEAIVLRQAADFMLARQK